MFKYSLAFFDHFIEKLTLSKFVVELIGNLIFTLYYVYLFVSNFVTGYLRYSYGAILVLSIIYIIVHLSTSFFTKQEIKNIKKIKDILSYIKIALRLLVVGYNIYLMGVGETGDLAKILVILSLISIAFIVLLDLIITTLIRNFFILRSAVALDYNEGNKTLHFVTSQIGVSPFFNNLYRQYGEDKYAEQAINLRIKKEFKDLINTHASSTGKLLHNNRELLAKYYIKQIVKYHKKALKFEENKEKVLNIINTVYDRSSLLNKEEAKHYLTIFAFLLKNKYHPIVTGLDEYDASYFLALFLYIYNRKSYIDNKEGEYDDIIFLIKMYGLYIKNTYYDKKDNDPFRLLSKDDKDDLDYVEVKNLSTSLFKQKDSDLNMVLNTLEKALNETQKKDLIKIRDELYNLIYVIRHDELNLTKEQLHTLIECLQDLIDASNVGFLLDKYRIHKAYSNLISYVTELGIS